MKRIISYCIVALAFVFGACNKDLPNQVDDESNLAKDFGAVRLNNSECEYTVHSDGLAKVEINGEQEYVTRFKLTDDNENTIYAYCANMESPCFEGASYKCASADDYFTKGEDTKIMAALTYMMNHYGEMEITNHTGFVQMVQCIIWRIVHGYEVTAVMNDEGELILEVINYVYDNIDDLVNDYNTEITIEGVKTAHKDGLFVNYGPYQVSKNALLPEVDFSLGLDVLLTNESENPQARLVDETGMEITLVKAGEPFYLQVSDNGSGFARFFATALTTEKLWYVYDYLFLIDVREGDYQQLFSPLMSDALTFLISDFLSITPTEPETEPEPEPEPETITLTELSWNNGNGGGINRFTVDGITLKSSKNYVTPENFDVVVAKTPGKNDETAIFTVTERTVTEDNGIYLKVYDIKVALYNDGAWKGYGGTITVDNPGGNDANQQVELERIF